MKNYILAMIPSWIIMLLLLEPNSSSSEKIIDKISNKVDTCVTSYINDNLITETINQYKSK